MSLVSVAVEPVHCNGSNKWANCHLLVLVISRLGRLIIVYAVTFCFVRIWYSVHVTSEIQ